MINMVEPRGAADLNEVDSGDATQDGELTTLIRRWMAVGTRAQDRARRDSVLQVLPDAEGEVSAVVEPEPDEDTSVAATAPLAPAVDARPADLPAYDAVVPAPGLRLPQRPTGDEARPVHRVALLIDARRVSSDVASVLLARLGQRGSVNVCRAYADWSRSELGDWVGRMRREGLHSFHHFSDEDDQALVAMTIDAVDIAREAAVDEVVIAGDLTSALPLVHRLHAAGVRVVVAGPGHTPHDVRAACHEFIDIASMTGDLVAPEGRHRA